MTVDKKITSKKILFLTWKDIKHPYAWWAERVIYEYTKWLVQKWHQVTWFAYSFPWWKKIDNYDGVDIIRSYTLMTAYFLFPFFYKNYFAWKYDIIIDEAGGLPLLSPLYEKNTPIFFFIHHIWDKERDYNYIRPISKIWKYFYNMFFKVYKDKQIITVSDSTKQELIDKFWYKSDNIHIIQNACDLISIDTIDFSKKKNEIVFVGRLMPIKRVEDAIKAFDTFVKFDKSFDNYILNIVWNDQDIRYVKKLKKLIYSLWIKDKVFFKWYLNREEYHQLMYTQKLQLVTSEKEWYGLVVLEWNSFWIPVIWYDVPWLKDSIKQDINWFLIQDWYYDKVWTKMIEILSDTNSYKSYCESALQHIKSLPTWIDNTNKFINIINEHK